MYCGQSGYFLNKPRIDENDCHELREHSVGTTPVLVSNRGIWVALVPQLQLHRLNWLLSVRYVNDVHLPVPWLFTVPVSRRRCYSCWNTLVSGCCQVPVPVPVPDCYRYRGLAACRRVCISLSFGHNWALLCTALCSTHNVTSSTAGCVLLFNGDVQTANVLSQYKCRLNMFDWLLNKETISTNLSLPCRIIYRQFKFGS